jgi:hypothetical protein
MVGNNKFSYKNHDKLQNNANKIRPNGTLDFSRKSPIGLDSKIACISCVKSFNFFLHNLDIRNKLATEPLKRYL